MTQRIYNFSPGPSMLPHEVMERAHQEFLNWHDTGMSIIEVSHRGVQFDEIREQSESDFRELLNISDEYAVLFLHGGAQTQFAMIPMNILGDRKKAAYVDTGIWSHKALLEAKKYCQPQLAASSELQQYSTIPPIQDWTVDDDNAYLFYCDNETITGVEFSQPPSGFNVPLVADMSSNILSKPIDIHQFGIVFACAQKNIGPAGLAIVIIRRDLFERKAHPMTPTVYDYAFQANHHCLANTPPTFPWYMAGLNFQWLKKQGGVAKIADINQRKAKKLYDFIDHSSFYHNNVDKRYRSRMSVPFRLVDESLNSAFLNQAEKNGLKNLKGHNLVGGMRASLYNGIPEVAVDILIQFMAEFERSKS